MPTLTPNIENRVRKLAKPSNAAQGLQPLFEAVSNSVYAVEDRFEKEVGKGKISISVTSLSSPDKIEIVVSDNGIGLDTNRYEAFCTIDTDFKRAKGGKGVGRLFWLDAFKEIIVESVYNTTNGRSRRVFSFVLDNKEQIRPSVEDQPAAALSIGTTITFRGLRTQEYADTFPKRADTFLRYFSAHFIADFLMGDGPTIEVDLDGDLTTYPQAVADLTVGKPLKADSFELKGFGNFSIIGFTCRAEASTGLDGKHQLHLLANGRTVETRKVDNLLGVTNLERNSERDLVFHGCVSGEYLDARVNEGRTAFNLTEKTLNQISRGCMEKVRTTLLPAQVEAYVKERQANYQFFVSRYPTFGFDDDETQLERVPFHATTAEEFAAGLVKYQIRREEDRQDALQTLIEALDLERVPANFQQIVIDAAKGIQASEQLALAQHVVRRKLALELLEKLIKRIRTRDGKDDDHHLEKTLHSFIVPMGVRGDNPKEIKSRAHELWIVDERLAFTRAFASDKRLDAILAKGGSADRPDLLLWDLAYGLGVTESDELDSVNVSEPLRTVMIVEFKKPGRTSYPAAEDQLENQITKYLAQLQGGEIESFDRTRVRVAHDCIFHCYVVADIIGDLKQQLSNWETTANGQGRIRPLKNQYRGSIEVIQWQDLVNDAWMRNNATLRAAGLSRSRPTLTTGLPPHSEVSREQAFEPAGK
ncbi:MULTISPECIES: sensor histidine kinase [unclassified Bradyrhizobium]|uniref:sensor histidine kinase n=1 Tax=unclassified Bradyrhizobium TaxID=2631580 RepID=UPI001FF3AD46|nr:MULTISPECIES: ATP-binding protein [unclassified Bradyrhizobium]MCJ9705961.1 ATP-binding protein [Bradyrhizobium sp. SHOUNA76]MCJ9731776.1 ATP-binding protein [Bradyrhizobium sp. PRIMUS42]